MTETSGGRPMHPDDATRREQSGFDADDWRAVEAELLARVKEVAQQITERCRLVSEGTQPHPPLPHL